MSKNFETKQENKGFLSTIVGKPTLAKASGLAFSLAAVVPVGISVLLLLVLQTFGLTGEGYTEKDWYLYLSYIIMPLSFFLVALWYFLCFKGTFTKSVKRQNCHWKYYLVAIVLQIGLFSLSQVNTWFIELLSRFGYKPAEINLPSMDGFGVVGILFAVALLPAVFEEIMFRGILLDGLHSFGQVGAILLCGGLFALYHQNPVQTVYQFCCGAAFALVALRSGSVLPTVLSHFLNNALVILLTKFGVTSFEPSVLIAVMGVSVLCLIGAIAYLLLDSPKKERFVPETRVARKKERRCFVGCAAVGVVFLSIMWLAQLFVGMQG